jgi:hypothetical protein
VWAVLAKPLEIAIIASFEEGAVPAEPIMRRKVSATRVVRHAITVAVVCLFIVGGFGVGLGGALSSSPSTSRGTTTLSFAPVANAQVEQAHPDKTYRRTGRLAIDGRAGGRVVALLRFNPASLSGRVQDAKLRLYVYGNATDSGPIIYRTGGRWTEAGVTWRTRPMPFGAPVAGIPPRSSGWVTLDVTPLVLGNGKLNLYFAEQAPHALSIASRDNAKYRPTLTVTTARAAAGSIAIPPPLRFAYSNRVDQTLMSSYGYTLIDVSTVDEARAVPAGMRAQVWLYDYDNTTCAWEKDDAYVRKIVSQLANDPEVAGFYFSNEPDPFACPNAPRQHRQRNALIKSLAPNKYTLIGIDANWRQHFDHYGSMWVGAADYVNYNPYVCYEWTSSCDFKWLEHVLVTAQSLPQPYFVTLQAFRERRNWRWPTPAEEAQMLNRLRDPSLTLLRGYMTFSWDWQGDPLRNHPNVLAEIRAFNLARPSPCCSRHMSVTK